jgi:hypothetical protein
MTRHRGRLLRRQQWTQVTYTRDVMAPGREPAYLELHDLEHPLEADEVVELTTDRGRTYRCRVIEDNVCVIIATLDAD